MSSVQRRNIPTDDLLAFAQKKARTATMRSPPRYRRERLDMQAKLVEATRRSFKPPQISKRPHIINTRGPKGRVREIQKIQPQSGHSGKSNQNATINVKGGQMSTEEFRQTEFLEDDSGIHDRMAQARAMRHEMIREQTLAQKNVPAQFAEVIHMRRRNPQNEQRRNKDGVRSRVIEESDEDDDYEYDNEDLIEDDIDEEALADLQMDSDQENDHGAHNNQDDLEDLEDLDDEDQDYEENQEAQDQDQDQDQDDEENQDAQEQDQDDDNRDLDLDEVEMEQELEQLEGDFEDNRDLSEGFDEEPDNIEIHDFPKKKGKKKPVKNSPKWNKKGRGSKKGSR